MEADCLKVCFDLEKDFLAALIHGSYGTEAENSARFRNFRAMRGAGGNHFPRKIKN